MLCGLESAKFVCIIVRSRDLVAVQKDLYRSFG